MSIAGSPFATVPFASQTAAISVPVSGLSMTIQEGFTQELTADAGHQVQGNGLTISLGNEVGNIVPANIDQQINLSLNWAGQDFLVCNSHIDVTGNALTLTPGTVTIDAQQVQQVTGLESTVSSQPSVVNYTVTVANPGSGNVFVLNGSNNPAISMFRATKYVFDQSDNTNLNHPLRFKDGAGNAYTDGVVGTGVPGTAGAKVEFTVPAGAPNSMRYYCTVHGNAMGNTITVSNYITISGLAVTSATGQQINLTAGTALPVITKIALVSGNQVSLSLNSPSILISQLRPVTGFELNLSVDDVDLFTGWADVTIPTTPSWANLNPGTSSTWTQLNATTSGTWTEVSTGTTPTWSEVTVPTDSNWTETK